MLALRRCELIPLALASSLILHGELWFSVLADATFQRSFAQKGGAYESETREIES